MPRAEWRRSWLYSSIEAATAARAWALVAKCSRRRSSNSNVECQDSITALSRADPGRPIDWRTPNRSQAARTRPAVYSAAPIRVQDDPADRLRPAAHRHRHGQRGVGQLGVVMLTQREPDDPA